MPDHHVITINDKCQADKQSVTMVVNDTVSWKAADLNTYYLLLPGNVFRDKSEPFLLKVVGTAETGPLTAERACNPIKDYIYDNLAHNCKKRADPPEITIE
ncbi:MAG: hypothetical protein JJE04_14890 [Acidobacteriia bacterium]|nr:hypothetical protein [Terriglobia bacterium]